MKSYKEFFSDKAPKSKAKAKEAPSAEPLPLMPGEKKAKKMKTLKQYQEETGNRQPGWINQPSNPFMEIRRSVLDAVEAGQLQEAIKIIFTATADHKLSVVTFVSLLDHVYGKHLGS